MNKKTGRFNRTWYRAFLTALAENANVSYACSVAGITRQTAYAARDVDEDFKMAWNDCLEGALDAIEDSLFQRAREKDTIAAIFILKSHRRALYGDKATIDLNIADLRESAIAKARELGLSEADAIETADDIEKRMKAGTL